jgi:CheY-like chemotaxis protein
VPLRCFIVDDNAQFLAAARALLEGQDVVVVGVASGSDGALLRIGQLRPDVVLVDIDLGDESGFDVARRIDEAVGLPVVLISTYAESDVTELVAESPAVGFLSKSDLSGAAIAALLAHPGTTDARGT